MNLKELKEQLNGLSPDQLLKPAVILKGGEYFDIAEIRPLEEDQIIVTATVDEEFIRGNVVLIAV